MKNRLVFVTKGSITESSTHGYNNTSAPVNKNIGGGSFGKDWRNKMLVS
jgi:myosin-crossreactive antigen